MRSVSWTTVQHMGKKREKHLSIWPFCKRGVGWGGGRNLLPERRGGGGGMLKGPWTGGGGNVSRWLRRNILGTHVWTVEGGAGGGGRQLILRRRGVNSLNTMHAILWEESDPLPAPPWRYSYCEYLSEISGMCHIYSVSFWTWEKKVRPDHREAWNIFSV